MLTGGSDVLYRRLLAANASPVSRVEVWRAGTRIDTYGDRGLPIATGSVSATLTSRVARNLNLTVHESLYPDLDSDLLSPYGSEIRAFSGVSGGGGPDYIWPVFRGRIDTPTLNGSGTCSISCVDRGGDVADSGFIRPMNSAVGSRVVDEFRRIVVDALPDATFGTSDELWERVPKLTWESDRASALDDLADGAHSFWYTLANGDFVIRRIPWTLIRPAVVSLVDGEAGTIVSASITKTRSGVVNQVIAMGERSDGTPPVFALAQDNDPSSPTYVNGPFGLKSKQIQAQGAMTQGQALGVARAFLKRSKALTENWNTAIVSDASLELGDVADLQVTIGTKTRTATQVVASYTLSLTGEPMSVSWRDQPDFSEE